ncbi:anthranilate synthase component I [bacterium]|nr:anthranilate synthase component I [bacterium]
MQARRRTPHVREILADLDTPLSAYLKLADAPRSFLLESVQGGEQWGRYSIIGLPCAEQIAVRGNTIERSIDGTVVETVEADDPLAWIDQFAQAYDVPDLPGLPRLTSGLVGYFGYDIVQWVEPRAVAHSQASNKPDPIGNPDVLLLVAEQLAVFDNLAGKIYLIVHADPHIEGSDAKAEASLDALVAQLREPLATPQTATGAAAIEESEFVSGMTQAGYEAAVERIKQYTLAGDVMQVVPSQRLTVDFDGEPINVYRALRSLNPSPYLYFFRFDDHHIVGSSPEILVRVEDDTVTVRPIAGTRPRGATPEEDKALEDDLLADPKELAEHLMLIDLGRNDVGRVAETGSVTLDDKMIIERYSHVMHIVSNVTGKLREGLSAIDALKATFPAGTLSGAPKVRAMEIIDELEPVRRGVYGGAVGYLAFSGDMDTAIAIRTAVIKNGQLHVQAGGGVVADSVPTTEWEETMNKARAVLRAVKMASGGL